MLFRSITQMDEVTQQNAALVEEAAAASQSLQDQGRQLTEAVAFFQMEGTTVASRPAAKPTHKPMVRAANLPVAKRAIKRSPPRADCAAENGKRRRGGLEYVLRHCYCLAGG